MIRASKFYHLIRIKGIEERKGSFKKERKLFQRER
jgi:hypothetical protein